MTGGLGSRRSPERTNRTVTSGNFAHGKHELRPGSSAKSRQSNGRSKGKVHSAQERVGAMCLGMK
jgi:hypothetical protein